ncbi:SDR family NAD(P)-dependent oxidoreductase [Amycolatopsis silviterrae]|uniref:SDR family NAD(P)-dependent oxidoreductase n=1 Tax=Amycolatopsis silviterrae TaxID=1656914 RepID=A0ABW5H3Q1_9PSEU
MATWFITGAARGLGAEIARHALKAGHDVAVGARRVGALPGDLRGERCLPVALDVTDQAQIDRAVAQAVDRFGTIDVLINNAGRVLAGALEEVTDAEAKSLFDVNVFGLINVTRAVLPVMRAVGRGKIVHIGSRAGFEGEPGVGLYSATKFAVAGISEALAAEVAAFGIQSMVVEPGAFRTDLFDASSLSISATRLAAYDGTPAHLVRDGIDAANHAQPGDPVKGAALIVEVTDGEMLPSHLLVGSDAYERLEAKNAMVAKQIAPWRDKALDTAHRD